MLQASAVVQSVWLQISSAFCYLHAATDDDVKAYRTSRAKVENDIELICQKIRKSQNMESYRVGTVTSLADKGQRLLKAVDKLQDSVLTDEILSDYKSAQRELVFTLLDVKCQTTPSKAGIGNLTYKVIIYK